VQLNRFGINPKEEKTETLLLYQVAGIYSVVEKRISDYLRPYNLNPSQFNALMVIKHIGKENGLSQVDISERLILSPSNMTRLLDKLNKDGLIERVAFIKDRRINKVRITEKGATLLDEIWPGYEQIAIDLTAGLSNNEQGSIIDLMGKWFKSITD
jgi:DNA-binding MarR family transcriptional regulator